MARALKTEPADPQDAYQQLADIVRKIEAQNDERDDISVEIKGIYAEAKKAGFDAKVIRKIVAKRRKDEEMRREEEEEIERYEAALVKAGLNSSGSQKRADPIKE